MSEMHCHALECAREGNWEGAHELVQAHDDTLSCLIHGYLHREEGDLGNAGYWYRRAGGENAGQYAGSGMAQVVRAR